MIAGRIAKPQLTPHEPRCRPVQDGAINSEATREPKEELVDTFVSMKNRKVPPRSSDPDSKQSGHSPQDRSLPRVGRELGPYRLLEWVGRGAEGDVWKAVRREPVEELVALKILKPSLASNPRARHNSATRPSGGDGWLVRHCSRCSS